MVTYILERLTTSMTLRKKPVQKQTHRTAQKHAKHQDATDI